MFKRRLMDLAVQRGELGGWVLVPCRAWQASETREQKQQVLCELLGAKALQLDLYR